MAHNNAKVDKKIQSVTCSGDVVQLLDYRAGEGARSYTLCKASMYYVTNNIVWVYMLLVDGDDYPIVISKEYAKIIFADPKKGAELAYNCWLNRYR